MVVRDEVARIKTKKRLAKVAAVAMLSGVER